MSDTSQQPQRRTVDPATQAELSDLLLQLSHNPKTRKSLAKAIKEISPNSPHAQAFADVEVEDKFENWTKAQEEKELKRQQDEWLRQANAKRAALLVGGPDGAGRKYSEDDLKKIEDLMTKKGIADYEDGAVLYASTLPPVDPSPGSEPPPAHGATWEIPEFAKFGADPVKASREVAHNVISEFMRKR